MTTLSLPEHIHGIYLCTFSADIMENCRIVTFQRTQKDKIVGHQVLLSAFHEWTTTNLHVQALATLFNWFCATIYRFSSFKNGWLVLCDFLWQVNIQDDCLEVGIGQDIYVTLQTWPQFCDVGYTRAYHVPGMGWGGVSCCITQRTKEFPFLLNEMSWCQI